MAQKMQILPGATVATSDGVIGTVREVIAQPGTGEVLLLIVDRTGTTPNTPNNQPWRIPADLIEARSTANQVFLQVSKSELESRLVQYQTSTAAFSGTIETGQVLRVPVAEERLEVTTRGVDLGELVVRKKVDTVEQSVPVQLTHDDVDIQRVPINQPLAGPLQPRYEGDILVLPVMQEVLVVTKQLMLTEVIRIRVRPVSQQQIVKDTVRVEKLEFEDTTEKGAINYIAPGQALQPGTNPVNPSQY